MIEFGEVLALLIAFLTAAYVIANWRSVRENPTLRPLAGPFMVFLVGWIATVVEDVFWQGAAFQFVVVGPEPSGAEFAGTVSMISHLVEHTCYMVAAAWLFWVIWRAARARREAPA